MADPDEISQSLDEHHLNVSEDAVRAMGPSDRAMRVRQLIQLSHDLVDQAIEKYLGERELRGMCVLFSGGNDSTTLAHLFRKRATHAVHANTTIGIEATRQYVRDTCKAWDLPLIEKVAPVSFEELVLEAAFPGPAHHYKMYQRLKERGLRSARNEFITKPRHQRVVFLAGRRRSESVRRADIPEFEAEGTIIWASPLVLWTKLDLATYRTLFPGVPRNPISDQLGMSGECLCGAFAEPGELDRIKDVDQASYDQIVALEKKVRAMGTHDSQRSEWGWGAYRYVPEAQDQIEMGRLCRCHDRLNAILDGAS